MRTPFPLSHKHHGVDTARDVPFHTSLGQSERRLNQTRISFDLLTTIMEAIHYIRGLLCA